MPKHNDLEQKALRLIVNAGSKGMLQSKLWRKLSASSREGSRIAIKLEKKGLIRRERELYAGRWTFRLYPTRQPISIDSIIDLPCFMCPEVSRCGPWSSVTPYDCEKLTEWILGYEKKEMNPNSNGET